jgi:hypothetical protein
MMLSPSNRTIDFLRNTPDNGLSSKHRCIEGYAVSPFDKSISGSVLVRKFLMRDDRTIVFGSSNGLIHSEQLLPATTQLCERQLFP